MAFTASFGRCRRGGSARTSRPTNSRPSEAKRTRTSRSRIEHRDSAQKTAMNILHRNKIVLLGMMSRMPVAGVVWQTAHYLVGLQRLGYDVYYVEASGHHPSSMLTSQRDDDRARKAAEFISGVMRRFGLGDDH